MEAGPRPVIVEAYPNRPSGAGLTCCSKIASGSKRIPYCRRGLKTKFSTLDFRSGPAVYLLKSVVFPIIVQKPFMKRVSTIFLQIVIVLLGIGVLAALLWEPQVEGRNVHATQFEIYFKDPFLAYIYLAFVPVFVGLYQVFKMLGYARANEMFSQRSVRALRIIKYCALTTAIFILGAVAYLFIFIRGEDDIAGGVAMGLFIIIVSALIATAAAVCERYLKNRGKMPSVPADRLSR